MGLDLVVIAKDHNGVEINPTEELGAKRACQDDPEVTTKLKEIYLEKYGNLTGFEKWSTELSNQEIPPIVIDYGVDAQSAIPAVSAECQYYGYRGKSVLPECNSISLHAEKNGISFEWLWEDIQTEQDFTERISLIGTILALFHSNFPSDAELIKQRLILMKEDKLNWDLISEDEEEAMFSYHALSGLSDWLIFWKKKGYVIAPDY